MQPRNFFSSEDSIMKMKAALITLLFLAAGHVFADETATGSMEDNTLGTLHYRSAAHMGYASLNFVDVVNDNQSETRNGNPNNHTSSSSIQSNLNLQYGITDLFLVGVSWNYNFGTGTDRTSLPSGALSSTTTKGLSDPTLTANYRYWGGLTGTHFGSAFVNLTPAIGSQTSADPGTTGNNISESSNLTLGTDLYWVSGMNEWEIIPELRYYTSGSSNHENPRNNSTIDARFNWVVDAYYRYHLSEKFYVQGALAFVGPNTSSYTSGNQNNAPTESDSTDLNIQPAVSVGWKVCNNALLALQYTYEAPRTVSNTTSGNLNSFTSTTDEGVVTLSAAATF
jgi:hypothetical protein